MGLEVPRIVWVGTALLSFAAGVVNVTGYLGFAHQALSHMTGTVSLGAIAVYQQGWLAGAQLLAVVLCFVLGAFVAGALLRERVLSGRYVNALVIEAGLLIASAYLFEDTSVLAACLAASACGLQNAMTSFYSGSAIRTTHLTGFFSDLGLIAGLASTGQALPRKRLAMWLLVILSFSAGGIAGALCFHLMGFTTLLVPAALVLACAIGLGLHLKEDKQPQ
jgi:uncharacterized membrane protein YoaK (UPF0700 family)